jgi:cell fate (sporulation/competence/biofilm development) regulator YlbF (YheA/YmcA/DUF963 family)
MNREVLNVIPLTTQMPPVAEAPVFLALDELANLIKEQLEYATLAEAYRIMRSDAEAQALLRELRAWQRRGVLPEDETAFQDRLGQFHKHPAVAAYFSAEAALKDLLKQVDNAISEAAGIEFAPNARRSCCGG